MLSVINNFDLCLSMKRDKASVYVLNLEYTLWAGEICHWIEQEMQKKKKKYNMFQ